MIIPKKILSWVIAAFGLTAATAHAAAPATPQGLITGKAFYNITGTSVANLTNSAKFPNNPDAMFFYPYFEWNATGDISTPAPNHADNYGGQLAGYFYPPATGDYIFFIAADDNANLYLSPTANPSDKRLIARETAWSNAREYFTSGGNSDVTAKDTSQFTGSQWPTRDASGIARITLQAGQPYYIEAIFKDGTGGDRLSVAVMDPSGVIDSSLPIPGEYLSSERDPGAASIATQPQSQTVAERGSVTFRVLPQGTPPYTYQWRRNGVDITDATGLTYTVSSATMADNNARYSVVVSGANGAATSQEAVLTVTPDTAPPTLLSAKGTSDRTGLVLTFSEPMNAASAGTLANYQINSASGPLNITSATLDPNGTTVTLATAPQTLGTKYTVLVSNLRDTAATPNTIAANSKAVFFPPGAIKEVNGMIVVEAENYDRNLDGRWVRDTTRGTPSGGASMVNPNGAGGSESATKIEFDIEFAQAATYRVWIRASGDNGNDDSMWLHLDGFRPVERETGNSASLTGFQPQSDFVWRSDSQDGPDPFTVDIPSTGMHTISFARREDGSFLDKFILTTDMAFTPTGFGPPETREGAPGLPTITLTAPTSGQTFAPGGNISLTSTAAGRSGLEITRVEYTANGELIGVATSAPFSFTWNSVPAGVYGVRATAFDELGQSVTSDSSVITVGTPPPQALLVVGTDSSVTLNAADGGIKARLESQGWQVKVVQAPASVAADADGKQLILVSSTVNSGDVAAKFRDVAVPVIMWEQAVQDDFRTTGLTDGIDRGTQAGQTQINIVNTTHALAAGLPAGLVTVTTNAQDYSWGLPAASAVRIATIADNPDRVAIYGYDKGAMLADGATAAPERRVMFFWGNNGFAANTPEAVKLFDAAVQWASGIAPQVKTSARIAWVSFHPADDLPSSGAATAGFTAASDVAYTQLLESQGHEVTRFVTTGNPDIALLNAYDLVIISRAVPSGDYQDAAETLAWNTRITAPTLILGGYIIRQNRLGLMAGSTIPDTVGNVTLTALEPGHPIFRNVQLNGANQLLFATPTVFNGTTNRGISVVTGDPAGGGRVLAVVGTPADPAEGGALIAEWDAGSTTSVAAADVLGGDRMIFLTGSREYSGLNSQGSGMFDLTAEGAKLFLNAVAYMAGVQPGGGPPTLSISGGASGVTITFTGRLQARDSLTSGSWTDVTATSPHTVNPTERMRFYRAVR